MHKKSIPTWETYEAWKNELGEKRGSKLETFVYRYMYYRGVYGRDLTAEQRRAEVARLERLRPVCAPRTSRTKVHTYEPMKTTCFSIEQSLLDRLDASAGANRSAFIRKAIAEKLASLQR